MNDGTVVIYSVGTNSIVKTLTAGTGKVTSVAYTLDGLSLVSDESGGTVTVWNTANYTALTTKQNIGGAGLVLSSDSKNVIAIDNPSQQYRFYDITSLTPGTTVTAVFGTTRALAASIDNSILAAVGSSPGLGLWEDLGATPVVTPATSPADLYCAVISPSAQSLVVGGSGGSIEVWQLHPGWKSYGQ